MALYTGLSKAFYWTPAEIDDIEIPMLFGYIVAMSKEEENGQYIDEVL